MEKPKQGAEISRAVRRALMTSAALAPMYFVSANVQAQVADAGPDQTVVDTDALPGESVALDGSGSQSSVPGQTQISSYVWTNAQGVQIASGATPTVRLPDGVNQIRLIITEDDGSSSSSSSTLTATDLVTITIQPSQAPTAVIAPIGTDGGVADTDGQPGEVVTLNGAQSSDPDGTITTYQWFRDGNTPLGTGATLQAPLPDGTSQITLVVTDNVGNTSNASATVTVGAAEPPPAVTTTLAELDLKPNQREVAKNLDDLCPRLEELSMNQGEGSEGQTLTDDQQDLLNRCYGIINDENTAQQQTALDELGAQDLNAMRTQALIFSRTQNQGVMDRLLALRAGERGTSVAGLNLRIGDKFVSAEQVADSLLHAFGGGASADEPGGLLDNRLGFWLRGNYGLGEKDATVTDDGFESDQWGFTGGVDYRFGESTVAGISLGYGKADLDFKPSGQGNLATKSLSGSIYGSAYLGNFYFDGVFNYADADYDSQRHIIYAEAGGDVDRVARGATGGESLSGGISVGYDFIAGGFTISPTLGYFVVDTAIDPFTETGANGLNLAYDEQNYESATGNAGLRISYAWRTNWGVVIPHLRGTYVREFEDATEVFSVRFASDPFASSADPTPPIIVVTDEPDDSYFRLAAGVSAQFPYDISGYFEYQRLEAFDSVDFQDFTIGLRIQHTFR
ncbi:MAG TPA: autotransporter domain-containing protein [Povalibacter sp.]|uniref:autotransporter domain-containing protein n=1 Tax=Povalibacter sp. TaxID=1962978 RepID=UPI002D02FB7F|nr:autotransporter domain-containing protein [Povalibacter sp.]HMN46683.1 autotransporter domain-containing protein [Povalibacter sp.]